MTRSEIEKACAVAKQLGDPTRALILLYLSEHGEVCVNDIASAVSMSQPAVSHHLSLLRAASVVETRRDSVRVFYSLTKFGKNACKGLAVLIKATSTE